MDSNLFNKVWFIRLFSLIMAIFLFVFVTTENRSFQKSSMNDFASLETSETITDVSVYLGDHDENIFVTGLPESVSVKITGPKNLVTQVTPENFEVKTESLRGKKLGKQSVRLEAEGLPKELNYEIQPARVSITLAEKKTLTMPVEFEVDPASIVEGAQLGQVTIKPSEVQLSGPAELIDRVSRVMINIRTQQPMDKSFTQRFKLQILDADGKQLAVNADIAEVDAQVEILSAGKDVTLNMVTKGENTDKFSYAYKPSATILHVTGGATNLANIEQVDLIVDVSGLKQSGPVKAKVMLPDGVSSDIQELNVYVEVIAKKAETTTQPESTESTSASKETTVMDDETTTIGE